jgi:hypothetical protein
MEMSLAENVATLPQPRGGNYEFARFNALRHGVLSQHTVLPWEDRSEYRALLEALVAEHEPRGRSKSASSKSWPVLSGASAGCGLARAPRIIAPSSAPPIRMERQQGRQ